jgi:hypothetical protein
MPAFRASALASAARRGCPCFFFDGLAFWRRTGFRVFIRASSNMLYVNYEASMNHHAKSKVSPKQQIAIVRLFGAPT